MRNLVLLFCVATISGCVSLYEPVAKEYKGDTAEISDTYTNLHSNTAHYFILLKVDDKDISQSWNQTRQENYGRGMKFTPSMVNRKVLPKRQKFTLQGLVFFPTDAQILFGDDMHVNKDVFFTPRAGEKYKINGVLNKSGSNVWIEDSSGKVVESDSGI